jgi:CheY-like chemotaxis protein
LTWRENVRGRLRELPARLLPALVIALGGAVISPGESWPWIWFAAAVAVQCLVLPLAAPEPDDFEAAAPEGGDAAACLAATLSAASFAGGAALFWLEVGWTARPFVVMFLAGGVVHVALRPRRSTRLLVASAAPFVAALLALPLIALLAGPPEERGVMGMTALVAALFVASVASAIRRNARRFERERQRAEAVQTERTEFLGQMNHELRTPLNGVLGMAQAMRIDPLTPEQLDRLDVIRDSGEALRAVLDELLDPPDAVAHLAGFAPAPQPDPELGERRLRVLAAEDNPTNQLVLRTLLGQAGIDVHVVGDGEAAVEAWRGAHWDLLLMDIRMPGMDGLAATRAIRAAEAAAGRRRTPIIAVSADATAREAAHYREAGIDCLVPKPIQFSQLATAIAAAVDARAARDDRDSAHG